MAAPGGEQRKGRINIWTNKGWLLLVWWKTLIYTFKKPFKVRQTQRDSHMIAKLMKAKYKKKILKPAKQYNNSSYAMK